MDPRANYLKIRGQLIKQQPDNAGMKAYDYKKMKAFGNKEGKDGKVIVDFESSYEPHQSFQ